MIGISDAGFLVAFANKRDKYHRWAIEVAQHIDEPLLTCEAVIAEAAYHLKTTRIVLDMIGDELIELKFNVNENMDRLLELAIQFADRLPDFADLCLIRMSELFPRHPVFTVDIKDFAIYRRNKTETIPIICPPIP